MYSPLLRLEIMRWNRERGEVSEVRNMRLQTILESDIADDAEGGRSCLNVQ